MSYDIALRSHSGHVKDGNEDHGAFRRVAEGAILALADGMSRLAGGEVASRTAVEALLSSLPPGVAALDEEPQVEALVAGFEAAHNALAAAVEEDLVLTGMGTTLVAALLGPERVVYQYCGDSRLYWLRDGAVLRVTRDHSVVQALVELGRVRPEEVESHPMAGKLMSYLGGANVWGNFQVSPAPGESASFQPAEGDVVLLCTDGVYVELGNERLAELACAPGSAEERAERILAAVLETKAHDNATVVLALSGGVGGADAEG